MAKGGDSQSDYWFKAKKYGWGWGLPLNLKGWVLFGLFLGIWLGTLLWLVSTGDTTESLSAKNIAVFAAILVVDIMWFVYVSFKYGEPPKWRWGSKRNATKSKSD